MRNIPMPIFLLYMHGNINECIDGQNRLTAIKQFIEQAPPPEDNQDKELEPFPWIIQGDVKQYVFYPNERTKDAMKIWCEAKQKKSALKKNSIKEYRLMTDEEHKKFKRYDITLSIIKERLEYEQRKEIFIKWQSGTGISYCDKYKNETFPFQEFVLSRNLEVTFAPKIIPLLKSGRKNWFMDIFRIIHIFLSTTKEEDIFPCEPKCKNIIEKHPFDEKQWSEALDIANRFVQKISFLKDIQSKMKLSCLLGIARLWSDNSKQYQTFIEDKASLLQFAAESLNTTSHNHCTLNNGPAESKFKEGFKLMKDLCLQKISLKSCPTSVPEVYKKQSIPSSKKAEVWKTYIGMNVGQTPCFICRTNIINMTTFEPGHIVAEKFGGTLDISNLQPICKQCNGSMGTLHMKLFLESKFPGRELLKPLP